MADETEAERVHRLLAGVLRAWLVEHEPSASRGAIVPLGWLRDEVYALREGYPGDRRGARARGYCQAIADVLLLLQAAEQRQRLDRPLAATDDEVVAALVGEETRA